MTFTQKITTQLNNSKAQHTAEGIALEAIEKLLETHPMFDGLEDKVNIIGTRIDIDNLTRSQVIQVISLSHTKWERKSYAAYLNYECTLEGVSIRLWNAAKPPSCVMTTRIVHYDAVPARDEAVTEISCAIPKCTEEPEAENLLSVESEVEETKKKDQKV